ncbi:MAG: hypothetical protein V7L25_24715 [Nostoc sp.]|uniref:hypothetical protein n=1 Tax=Nostoc sp. TaxID=1180 RepID=UPI002FF118FC
MTNQTNLGGSFTLPGTSMSLKSRPAAGAGASERQPFLEKRFVIRHLNFGDSALFW